MSVPDHQAVLRISSQLYTDEKVYEIREAPRFIEATQKEHLIQRIRVNRGDKLVWFEMDLGPMAEWPTAHHFSFWADFEYSVGEVMEIAEHLREGKSEPEQPRDLWGDWIKFVEEKQYQKVKRTTVGPDFTVQRG